MTAQERFYTALSGGTPDRVPTLGKIWVDLAAALTGTDLLTVIEDPPTAMRVMVEAALVVKADGARLFHFPARRTRVHDDMVYEVDATGRPIGTIDMQGGLATRLFEQDWFRLDDPYHMAFAHLWSTPQPLIKNINDVKRMAVPDKSFYEEHGFGKLQREMRTLAGDRVALLGNTGSATMAFAVLVRQMENALLDLVDQPALTHAIMEKGQAIAIEMGKFNVDCGLKILRVNDSVGNMSVISPAHWREFVFPHMKTVCDELHRYDPEVRIYCHICGNCLPVLPDLVEMGLDCIGPLDPLGGFTCAEARSAVGDRVALMGGVNTLSFVDSTPQALIDEARQCIEAAGRQGGYILGSGCTLPRNSRPENLLALHEAARQFGTYEVAT